MSYPNQQAQKYLDECAAVHYGYLNSYTVYLDGYLNLLHGRYIIGNPKFDEDTSSERRRSDYFDYPIPARKPRDTPGSHEATEEAGGSEG